MRGMAPSGQCPRCDELQPAGAERLTTCVTCGLRFDANAPPRALSANRASAGAAEPLPAGVVIEPDRLLLPRQVFSGAAILAVVLVLAAVVTLGVVKGQFDHAWEYVGIGVLGVVAVIRLPAAIQLIVGRRTITVEARSVVAETVPFAGTRVELSRKRIEQIAVTAAQPYQDRSVYSHRVYARVDGNAILLIKAEDDGMARFIATWLEDRLELDDAGLDAILAEYTT